MRKSITNKIRHYLKTKSSTEEVRSPLCSESIIFRGELYSFDQLGTHAERLALSHQLAVGRAQERLISRLDENEKSLLNTYKLLAPAAKRNRPLAPGAEWLLDNFYLIEEKIYAARENLPPTYEKNLPRLSSGTVAGLPRVFSLVIELISHVDGKVDAVSLNGFLESYQRITPLKLGELWAIPIMLSLALIENLRCVGERVASGYRDQDLAAEWAELMAKVVESNPLDLILVMADMARADPAMSGAFLAEITRHLRGNSPHFSFANGWLEHRVAAKGQTIEQIVQAEGQAQAADQVSIGHCITSLRFLSSNDWRDFVEQHSVVEHILRTDPADVHGKMNFATRNQYREVVEVLSRSGNLSESEIAVRAIQLSAKSKEKYDINDRRSHVGYYLVDEGIYELEKIGSVRNSLRIELIRILGKLPLMAYLGGIISLTSIICLASLAMLNLGGESFAGLMILALPFIFCALHLGIGMTNWLATLLVRPKALPRMDFENEIPVTARTLIVIPTMISNAKVISKLLDGLEVRYLANRDEHLHFGILSDFDDAITENMPGDLELVAMAREGIKRLNLKYSKTPDHLFFLFHRPRVWNSHERKWMGRERKRGKLLDLNDLLRGRKEAFIEITGDYNILLQTRYVITLDTDTELPRDSAREMIGAMAHPLNKPLIDPAKRRVTTGYGILQPRIGVCLAGSQKSWFVKLFAGESGIDPYTRVVSDIYQDIFGEGSFIGKGIYDVDAFAHCCAAFPDNAILSHDLIESACARSALLSDVELYEDYPSHYSVDVSRRHRWMRGDWQLFAWLIQWVPGGSHRIKQTTISPLSWWKIFDNLRRSTEPCFLLALVIGSWTLISASVTISMMFFVLLYHIIIPVLSAVMECTAKSCESTFGCRLQRSMHSFSRQFIQSFVRFVLLPYEAMISIDAITRTMFRMCWSKNNLLEWKTSIDAHHGAREDLLSFVRTMWIGPFVATAIIIILTLINPLQLLIAGPILSLWFVSPIVAWWLSRTLTVKPVRLTDSQRDFLEKLSRKTWRYFEDFVTREENWLPPDNIQDYPAIIIASRTSPTNIGMALLSDMAALDFGFCSTGRLLERVSNTLSSLGKMERYKGHYYNWYDTRTLNPLYPRYISSVDSGNLSGALFVLRAGLLEIVRSNDRRDVRLSGLRITASVLFDTAKLVRHLDLISVIDQLLAAISKPCNSGREYFDKLNQLKLLSDEISTSALTNEILNDWARAFKREVSDCYDELLLFSPWLTLLDPPKAIREDPIWQSILKRLESQPSLYEIASFSDLILPDSKSLSLDENNEWAESLRVSVQNAATNASDRIKCLEQLARQCDEFLAVDYRFLFDEDRKLFAVGYNDSDHRLDNSYYDLLASESRLTSYLAIAMGQVGQEHWFSLGRKITATGGATALLSWSGSMFEYLMPLLIMPTYENTLLDQTYKAIVRRQINYGRQRSVPWGISESGYSMIDQHMVYQYRAFGVPGLGLKRGLVDDLVIAPYATALALMVEPEMACRNLEQLSHIGQQGNYGLYEAIDYSTCRVSDGTNGVIVRQFMAHHQGMSLLSLVYLLRDKPMQRRFESDPILRAADLLLQERVPRMPKPIFPHVAETSMTAVPTTSVERLVRDFTTNEEITPEVQLLSNGQYHVVLSTSGSGYSRWRDLALTRWREDSTRDCWGSYCFLKNIDNGSYWSTTQHPTLKTPKRHSTQFTQSKAQFFRSDDRLDTNTEISVSPEDDVELRRVTITNRNKTTRTIEITSYSEVILASLDQDLSHPAFSNLFVQTELVRERNAILCTRRPRSAEENPPWLVHMMTVQGTSLGEVSFETDRMKFIGRGRNISNPVAMGRSGPLTDSQGSVLDPVVSIRRTIRIESGQSVQIDIITGAGESRDSVSALMTKYSDPSLADRVFELAWTHSQIQLRQLNTSESDALIYCQMAGSIIYASSLRRAKSATLLRNRRGQSSLWSYGISGDFPIVLLRIRQGNQLDLVRQVVQAHAYWRLRGLKVDLVIWNEDDSVYHQPLQNSIMDLVSASSEATFVDKPGGVFVRRGEQMAEEDRVLLLSVARVVLTDDDGPLLEQVNQRSIAKELPAALVPTRRLPDIIQPAEISARDLKFFNGLGGFSHDGREYVVTLAKSQSTPAPWVNVIANAHFGTVISETGSSYTWAENSHEFRLTPWYNDPVSDTTGESLYIRDEETGQYWSPTPGPCRNQSPYVSRHGFGYSIFENSYNGITTELSVFVATDEPVKFLLLKIANRSGRPRKLTTTAYWELVLGELRDKSLMHVVTEIEPDSGAIFAKNGYSKEFSDRIAFVDCSERSRTVTGDRTEFLGRNGSVESPAALRRSGLSGRVGAGFDPCAAIQSLMYFDDGQEKEIVFIIGAAGDHAEAKRLLWRFNGVNNAKQTLEGVWRYWNKTLGVIYCETPDPSVNFLANGWLIYQTLSCRMWARTGFYQSGGAFGFRDQLQDAMALVHAEPRLFRDQLLRAAGRQFIEGDVQHWWHPPRGCGVRTHFSDDYLWLPYATCRYVSVTGDTGVLNEKISFLSANLLKSDEEAVYDLPQVTDKIDTLYEHCLRALWNGLRFGEHGLPLIGCGDWNDGMNLVGKAGKGESVWLAFFFHNVLTQFAELARSRDDHVTLEKCTLEAGRLRGNIEANSWDGEWYRRAYFDDGTPLGSASNEECQIDSISQSWSVLSGAGTNDRMVEAMENLDRRLVRRDASLIQLLDPPFDKSSLNPGYIKGYLPGVRENGGQYTHAAIWAVMAFAKMGNSERAWELFHMINPILHGNTSKKISVYRVEPYVVAADVYAVSPHIGRGGWTWYTGSSGWMYRLISESLLGLNLEVDKLRFNPCLPPDWKEFKIHFRYRETVYHITFLCHSKLTTVQKLTLDGKVCEEKYLMLHDDRQNHSVVVELG